MTIIVAIIKINTVVMIINIKYKSINNLKVQVYLIKLFNFLLSFKVLGFFHYFFLF